MTTKTNEFNKEMESNFESKFVIKHDTWGDYNYYSTHGEFAGEKEVMSFTSKNKAKQFNSSQEAENYILNLPEWTKKEKYIVEELRRFEMYIGY